SNPVDVEVRELPAARPPEFSGNIGDLRVSASASQTKMPVGTPFTFTVRLEGQGYLPRSGSLDLAGSPEFTRRFRVLANQDRALADNLREVTYTLRPNSAAVTEVPSVYVGYFDTKLDEFRTAKSAAIPLEVTGSTDRAGDSPTLQRVTDSNEAELPALEDLKAAQQRGFWRRNVVPAAALSLAVALVAGTLLGGRMRRGLLRL